MNEMSDDEELTSCVSRDNAECEAGKVFSLPYKNISLVRTTGESIDSGSCDKHPMRNNATLFWIYEGQPEYVLVDAGAQVSYISKSAFLRSGATLRNAKGLGTFGDGNEWNPARREKIAGWERKCSICCL